ncbi:hypothetical protein NDU88_008987 [Pleurodeles waltl]|uniref:Uncharacterized protein n=1 Tax=Pleurodeles waltl TaxID=8319 RepID=A0AAV7P569_PLEWA|nr:hypothetical protein NDU88_008987 [Pleurodeles waltl]
MTHRAGPLPGCGLRHLGASVEDRSTLLVGLRGRSLVGAAAPEDWGRAWCFPLSGLDQRLIRAAVPLETWACWIVWAAGAWPALAFGGSVGVPGLAGLVLLEAGRSGRHWTECRSGALLCSRRRRWAAGAALRIRSLAGLGPRGVLPWAGLQSVTLAGWVGPGGRTEVVDNGARFRRYLHLTADILQETARSY